MQQYLPFTVLKLTIAFLFDRIEQLQQYLPFTVLKRVYAEEVLSRIQVATVLTVYGIETGTFYSTCHDDQLQQYLPFTVLKL